MSHDTWLHRIARRTVRPLVHTPVTPNHLTSARLLSGVGAAACFAAGSAPWNLAGALLFVASMLLDRADGELARLQRSGSRFGALYDLWTDAICNVAVFLGLGIAAVHGFLGAWAVPAGLLAGISIGITFALILAVDLRFGSGTMVFDARGGFDPDDAMIAVPLGVVAGFGDVLVLLAAICAPLAMVIVGVDVRRRWTRLLRAEHGAR
jgi:phosphatidylglycerophosphate synthase